MPTCKGMQRIFIAVAVVGMLVYISPPAAEASDNSFDLGRPTWSPPFMGDQEIEVGLCMGPEGQKHRSLEETVSILNDEYNPYVEWLTNGNLRIRAVEGRLTQGRHGTRTSHGNTFEALICDDGFWGRLPSYSDGAIHYLGLTTWYDSGSPDRDEYMYYLFRRFGIIPEPYPYNSNWVQTLGFPYNMNGLPVILRYWNGWIDSDSIKISTSNRAESFTIEPTNSSGVQMLVIPSTSALSDAYMYVLGARVSSRANYDGGLVQDGIEIYRVKLRKIQPCTIAPGDSQAYNCWRVSLADEEFYPEIDTIYETVSGEIKTPSLSSKQLCLSLDCNRRYPTIVPNLYDVRDSLWIEGNLVSIDERDGDTFRVTVTPFAEIDWDAVTQWWDGHFRDDDGNVHEGAINALADRGIIDGYLDRTFNPKSPLTRADMAVMLTRALDTTTHPVSSSEAPRFTDVADDAEYGPAINYLAEIGVTRGYPDGTFKPEAPITRAQFASLIVRAFPQYSPVENLSNLFTDVTASSTHATTIQALYEAGVTKGCGTEPLRYCPSILVKRDQAASFLARVLETAS